MTKLAQRNITVEMEKQVKGERSQSLEMTNCVLKAEDASRSVLKVGSI